MDDLVAELTLRLRNEMTAGLDEVRSQFTSLDGPLDELRQKLGAVDALMGDMHVAPGMAGTLGEISAEASDTAAAMRDMGATLDVEAQKARDLFAETAALRGAVAPPPEAEETARPAEELRQPEPIAPVLTPMPDQAAALDETRQHIAATVTEIAAETTKLQDAIAAPAAQFGATLTADQAELQQLLVLMHQAQDELHVAAQPQGGSSLGDSLKAQFEEGKQAAEDMAGAVAGIGTAIDTDQTKMQQLLIDMHEAQSDMASAAISGGGRIPPPATSSDDEEPETPASPNGRQPQGKSGGGFDLMGLLIGGITGLTGFDAWSEYDTAAKQIAVTEGLGPKDAQHEAARLKDMMNSIADRYYASSKDLMETYGFLITDSLSKQTVESMLPPMAEASTAYNVPTFDIAQAAFTLTKNLGIAPEHMGDALAVLHHATMMGHFNMEDFSHFLPEIGGQESLIGMTGMPADVTTAAALEMIRRNTSDGGVAATGLKEFLTYLHSMMALRMFDRTKRMEDMLGPSGKAIMEKYHIQPLDLPQYLDAEQKIGVDPINAMTAYFSHMLAPVKSPIERADLVGAYFHNLQAQDAMLALVQYRQDFVQYQEALSHVSDQTLGTDFSTATSGGSADSRAFHENLSQGMRMTGKLFDYPVEFGNWAWNPNAEHGPPPVPGGPGNGAPGSGITLSPHIPITVNVHVDKDGNATVTGGLEGAPNLTPGTTVGVNQGNVLTGVH